MSGPGPSGAAADPATVLVVEDEDAVRMGMVDFLEDEGYRVLEATDGAEGLARLQGDDVSLAITDLQMPGVSGIDFLEAARVACPDVPCIIVSGRGLLEDAIAAIRLGAYDYLMKPIPNMEVLGVAVRRALETRRLTREHRAAVEALARRNVELERAQLELRHTQGQLVQSAKMAALGELVAGVAHELNNPLGFVYSNVRVMGESIDELEALARSAGGGGEETGRVDALASRLERLLEGCRVGSERARQIVENLRRFSRTGEGERSEVSLRESLETAVTLLSHRLTEGVRLHRDLAEVPPLPCRAGHLNQVFVNLLANALDAVEGGGDVWLSLRREGDRAVVAVRDSGPGVPAEVADRIFEPFFTTKPQGKGTGLGLSVSYGIVRDHGGTLDLVRPEGGGTELRVSLPLVPPDPDASPGTSPTP